MRVTPNLACVLESYFERVKNTDNFHVRVSNEGGLDVFGNGRRVHISPQQCTLFKYSPDPYQAVRDIIAKVDFVLFPPPPPKPLRRRIGAGKRGHILSKRQWLGAS
jgi:hypothetical protein